MYYVALILTYLIPMSIGVALMFGAYNGIPYCYFTKAYSFLFADVWSFILMLSSGVVIFLLPIRVILGRNGVSTSEKIISYKGSNGLISVNLIALEEMLRKYLADFPQLKDVRPYMSIVRKGTKKELKVTIKTTIEECSNIADFSVNIQDSVRSKLSDVLGQEQLISVNIAVRKISAASNTNNVKKSYGDVPYSNF